IKIVISMIMAVSVHLSGQNTLADETLYSELEKQISAVQKDPLKTQKFIHLFAKKAKSEKNEEKLYRGYALGTIYAENRRKSAYADSMLHTAAQINRPDILGDAHMMNGMLHQLNEDYNVSLQSYVQAQNFIDVDQRSEEHTSE